MSSLPSRREQGGLGLEARHAAARLWLQLGCLHMKEQPAAADSDTPAASVQPGKTVHCLQQAALKCQAFGEQLGNRSWAMKLNARAQLSLCVCVCVCVCMCVCVCVYVMHSAWSTGIGLGLHRSNSYPRDTRRTVKHRQYQHCCGGACMSPAQHHSRPAVTVNLPVQPTVQACAVSAGLCYKNVQVQAQAKCMLRLPWRRLECCLMTRQAQGLST